jgi:hypothetical protein
MKPYNFEIDGVRFSIPVKDCNWRISFRENEQKRLNRYGVIPVVSAVRANLNSFRQSGFPDLELSEATKERLLKIIGI